MGCKGSQELRPKAEQIVHIARLEKYDLMTFVRFGKGSKGLRSKESFE